MTAVKHRCNTRGGGWTLDTLQEHWETIEKYKEAFSAERDRRYAEVGFEREKALRIKEDADKAALALASEIQKYKDEKANELREQINSERGLYATKDDLNAVQREIAATIQPLHTYVAGKAGEIHHADTSRVNLVALISVIYGIMATIGVVASFVLHR